MCNDPSEGMRNKWSGWIGGGLCRSRCSHIWGPSNLSCEAWPEFGMQACITWSNTGITTTLHSSICIWTECTPNIFYNIIQATESTAIAQLLGLQQRAWMLQINVHAEHEYICCWVERPTDKIEALAWLNVQVWYWAGNDLPTLARLHRIVFCEWHEFNVRYSHIFGWALPQSVGAIASM